MKQSVSVKLPELGRSEYLVQYIQAGHSWDPFSSFVLPVSDFVSSDDSIPESMLFDWWSFVDEDVVDGVVVVAPDVVDAASLFGVDTDAGTVTAELIESLGIDDDDVLVSNCDDGRLADDFCLWFGAESERAGDHSLFANGQLSIKLWDPAWCSDCWAATTAAW